MLRDTHNGLHPKRRKKARKAQRKLNTFAGRLIRELQRKLEPELLAHYQKQLELYLRILEQKRGDKNKTYSIHKPFISCIAKGKAHKPYEFGNKIGLVVNPKTLVVTAIDSYEGNPHDSKTIEPLIDQIERNIGRKPKEIVYDRGGRGKKVIRGVNILTPGKPLKHDTISQRKTKRKKFRRRAAIEPVIGHLKTDFRMGQNYLHGKNSPKMNAMLAAAGWNFKKWMEKLKKEAIDFLFSIFIRFEKMIPATKSEIASAA